mgnify:CR=1 FL=1
MDIHYSKQATKFLQKQPKQIQHRIITAINKLPAGDVKKMQGSTLYRLRVGDFRVLFNQTGEVLFIEKIGNRGEVYKD